jgi:hypothetical protein
MKSKGRKGFANIAGLGKKGGAGWASSHPAGGDVIRYFIHIIPEEPGFVPEELWQKAAMVYLSKIARGADNVSIAVTQILRFIHCGTDFGDIFCPACKVQLAMNVWQGWMRDDYHGETFVLSEHVMPCCGARHTLHEMAYERPMGFARCDIKAMNPKMEKLPEKQRQVLERILGCPLRVIYEYF